MMINPHDTCPHCHNALPAKFPFTQPCCAKCGAQNEEDWTIFFSEPVPWSTEPEVELICHRCWSKTDLDNFYFVGDDPKLTLDFASELANYPGADREKIEKLAFSLIAYQHFQSNANEE